MIEHVRQIMRILTPVLCGSLVAIAPAIASEPPSPLRTVAERSGFRATATHADVLAFGRELAAHGTIVREQTLGRSFEGRTLPLYVVSDPPVRTPQEARASGKLVVLALGNIHAGEVDGKEALLAVMRRLNDSPDHPLLRDIVLLVAPLYNADGNERFSRTNRPGQAGPEAGMGIRENAQGFDLNRDFVKIEAPETQALLGIINAWDPHIFIDMHTTNGSHHRYPLTYQGPSNPAGDAALIAFSREQFFPAIARTMKTAHGMDIFPYGNFNRDHTAWSTYAQEPRYGTSYMGLRHRLGVLSESYAYASYEERVRASEAFVLSILEFAAAHRDALAQLLAGARQRDQAAGISGGDPVSIRSQVVARDEPVTALGYVEERTSAGKIETRGPKDYTVKLVDRFVSTVDVPRPWGYLIPAACSRAAETLQRHGFMLETLREELVLTVEVDRVESIARAARSYQGHHAVTPRTSRRAEERKIPAGTWLLKTEQPLGLGALAVFLLEPGSQDSLYTWNFFDPWLKEGQDAPVLRLPRRVSILTRRADGGANVRNGAETDSEETERAALVPGAGPLPWPAPQIGRRGMGSGQWLDAHHLLQPRDGKLMKVDAATGKAEPFLDVDALARTLASQAELEESLAQSLARRTSQTFDKNYTALLYELNGDLVAAKADGSSARRLTRTAEEEELATFSPDGKSVAFVRDYDLYVVDVATGNERRLTTGGNTLVRHGKADWVYFEEIFNRSWKAFWWSLDSRRIAFLECDDRGMPTHEVLIETGSTRIVESTPYPRSGEANPKVRVGIVNIAGGPVRHADLSGYSADSIVISDVGWLADGQAFAYVQNRIQTWLDMVRIDALTGNTTRLFRDQTKAWIESLGQPFVLKDGSFLVLSDRDGWKHIYHYEKDGKLRSQLTKGEWEVRSVAHLDEADGELFILGTKDNPIGPALYKVKLADGGIEKLSQGPGTHSVSVSSDGEMYVDSWSSHKTPPESALFDKTGKQLRVLDAPASPAPVPPSSAGTNSKQPTRELLTITARDGTPLQAELALPADFDPEKKYPVWFTTYGGPHSPTISDSWAAGRGNQGALARGFVVFRMDPRSASGRGSVSAWTAYKRLGIPEIQDITDAIEWLKREKPYVDGDRIGMTGHSYGGFMTSFAMTHTKLFAAGIAGAPVTDWHDYDSIYTERFMQTPQENPDGYRETSVVRAAGNLHGKLLILHGAIDDNVSVRNTMRLVHALQQANKDFELMIYPSARHGIFGPHYEKLMMEFMTRVLGGPRAKPSSDASAATPPPPADGAGK